MDYILQGLDFEAKNCRNQQNLICMKIKPFEVYIFRIFLC